MSEQETLLADVPLVADPDASKEMGAADVEAIARGRMQQPRRDEVHNQPAHRDREH